MLSGCLMLPALPLVLDSLFWIQNFKMIRRRDGEDATLWVLNVYVHSNPLAGLFNREIFGTASGDVNLVNKDYII